MDSVSGRCVELEGSSVTLLLVADAGVSGRPDELVGSLQQQLSVSCYCATAFYELLL